MSLASFREGMLLDLFRKCLWGAVLQETSSDVSLGMSLQDVFGVLL